MRVQALSLLTNNVTVGVGLVIGERLPHKVSRELINKRRRRVVGLVIGERLPHKVISQK